MTDLATLDKLVADAPDTAILDLALTVVSNDIASVRTCEFTGDYAAVDRDELEAALAYVDRLLPVLRNLPAMAAELRELRGKGAKVKEALPVLNLPAVWGHVWLRGSCLRVFHLSPNGNGRRACAPDTDIRLPLATVTKTSRACPACLAIATEGK